MPSHLNAEPVVKLPAPVRSRKRRRLAVLAAIGLACFQRLAPQSEDVNFINVSKNDGLSHETVYSILQDRDGFVWLGTENGLNRFDGYDFTVFQHSPDSSSSLSHSAVLKLYEDRGGIIWVGTLNGGLNRFDPEKGAFTNYRHARDRSDSLSDDIVGAILEDRDGGFWIGTDNGLNRLDRATGKFTRFPLATDRPGSSNHIHGICEDSDGMLWIATFGGGLIRLDRRTGRFSVFRNDPADPASLNNDFLYAVHEDRTGTLWVCTQSGLNRHDRRSGRFARVTIPTAGGSPLRDEPVIAACEDSSGQLWFGTTAGLVRLDARSGAATVFQNDPLDAKSLSSNQVFAIHEDRSGILWIGTGDTGVDRFNPNRKKFSHYRALPGKANSLGATTVYGFWEDPDRGLWIATHDGLDRLDRKTNSFSHFGYHPGQPGSLGKTIVRCLAGDRDGNLWLGTDGKGLLLFDRGSGRVTAYRHEPGDPTSISNDRILAICEDMAGSLWIGTYGGGLNRMDRKQGTFTRYRFNEKDPGSLAANIVRAVSEDHGGTLWIGTYGGGLDRFDRQTGRFIHYRHDAADPASLNSNYVFCIHEGQDGALWVGTLGGGLSRLDREKDRFVHFTPADGLASDMVCGILEDRSGNLWLTTAEGLSRFSPRTRQFRNYDASDGLQSGGFISNSILANREGEMFIGGGNGFNIFLPQNIFDNVYVPPVWLTSFKVLNREVKLPRPIGRTSEILLRPQDALFSFEFAALDYTAPEKNRYAYRLEGLMDDWVQTDSRRRLASFSRLPPGRYVFRVRGSNSDGLWNEKETSLVIRVLAPWWRSWWFLALASALALLLLYEWRRDRVRRMAARVRTEAARDQLFAKVGISPREREIVQLLLKGRSNREIADELFIELSTVKIHVHHIFKKLAVRNRAQLLRLFQNLKT
ncbi:MAG: LuxR C-terminal-related transcriptional regulator [Acidobacteria bacterium]|jgi:ligand-binding sensor domain-containing protein/DNA-binding CsgD family transcriptional regulator|nr:LuxR C-terminal-related transcriptional regulator [Acidobacteriota bacterium]